MTRLTISLSLGVLVLSGSTACSTSEGTIQLALEAPSFAGADAQRAELATVDGLFVTIDHVDVHIVDTDAEPEDRIDGEWLTIFDEGARIDLFDVAATGKFLGAATVPAGQVTQVRLVIPDDATLIENGDMQAVPCSSCAETGLKLVPAGTLEVPAGGTLALTLDFRLESLVGPAGNLRLNPVIRIDE